MEVRRIEKPKLRKKFWEMMKNIDNTVAYKEYNRTVTLSDGTSVVTQYYMKPSELERTKVERVFTTLLNWYTDHYNMMVATMPEGTYSSYSNEELPELLTTNINVGKSAGCSDRTARTMISKLEMLGILTKNSKGSSKGITIKFSNTFLWGNTHAEIQQAPEALVLHPLAPESSLRKLFPNIDTKESESEIVITTNADLSISDKERMSEGQRDKHVASKNPQNSPEMGLNATKGEKHTEGPAAESYPQQAVDKPKYDDWTELCRQTVMRFWAEAYTKIYAHRRYDKESVRTILKLVWTDVYNSFEGIRNAKELALFSERQLKKIDLAAKWYNNHEDAYLPDPYDIVVEGKGYFSKKNLRGFAGLEAWLRKEEADKKNIRANWINPKEFKARKVEHLLRQCRRDFEKFSVGAKPRVEVATLDIIGLQQYYGAIFAHMGENAQKRFNELVLGMQKRNFQPVKKAKTIQHEVVDVESWMGSFEYY